MTRTFATPTTALTLVEARPVAAVLDDASALDEDEVKEVLAHHDQRSLFFAVGAGLLCGPLAFVAAEAAWFAPFVAAIAAGVGGIIGQIARRRETARTLGVTDAVIQAVEGEWTRATIDVLIADLRARRFGKALFRLPAETRDMLAPRIRARLAERLAEKHER